MSSPWWICFRTKSRDCWAMSSATTLIVSSSSSTVHLRSPVHRPPCRLSRQSSQLASEGGPNVMSTRGPNQNSEITRGIRTGFGDDCPKEIVISRLLRSLQNSRQVPADISRRFRHSRNQRGSLADIWFGRSWLLKSKLHSKPQHARVEDSRRNTSRRNCGQRRKRWKGESCS